eukprot:TRINITY_DN12760_c0_g1_i1.p4 TRINITY_DN12760_c0_g1~~TRINITY_DN12760_c0_g1_i1.p4  ORF type:complete len:111 (-),score=49.04 TRINITY_DN12760_c0_g1_i1:154-486(-)
MLGVGEALAATFAFGLESLEFPPPRDPTARTMTLRLEAELDALEHGLAAARLPRAVVQRARAILKAAYEADPEETRLRTLQRNQQLMATQNCCRLVTTAAAAPPAAATAP